MTRMALIVVLSALLASTMPAAAADHELKLVPSNTHTGSFDARIKPVLRIAPGDTVKVETLVAFGMDRLLAAGASEAEIPDSVKAMDKYMKEKDLYGGTLTGPIYVEGAQTGDTLEVQILPGFEFLHPYGWTGFRGRGTLVPGSSLYIPVHVPGALLSIGDGHAVQGDGEINGGALETSLRGSVRIQLHKGKFIKWPRAETPTHFITMGLNTDLNEAARMAVREMIDYLVSERGLARDDAYLLCSQAVDLRVTQLVDGVKGIHAMIPKSIFR